MTYSDWTRVLETSCNIFFLEGGGEGGGAKADRSRVVNREYGPRAEGRGTQIPHD